MKRKSRIISVICAFALLISVGSTVEAQSVGQPSQAQNSAQQVGQGRTGNGKNVQALINRLEQGHGQIPQDFTLDDMNAFIAQADPDIVNAILANILNNAKPIQTPDTNANANSQKDKKRSNTYLSYDCATGKQQHLTFDISDPNTSTKVSDGDNGGNSVAAPLPRVRAYPNFWFEVSPQSYYDTKPMVKLIVKLKGGRSDGYASGFLVSNNTIVTASHCIYSTKDFGGWCDYLIVYPCCSASSHSPYGYATSTTVWIGGFPTTDYRGDDWGAAKLSTSFSIGYFGMVSNTATERGKALRIQGYPGCVTSAGNPTDVYDASHFNYNLYLAQGTIGADESAYLKDTVAMSYAGMSGGAVLYSNNGTWVAGGIISAKNTSLGYTQYVAFDNNLYNQIKSIAK